MGMVVKTIVAEMSERLDAMGPVNRKRSRNTMSLKSASDFWRSRTLI